MFTETISGQDIHRIIADRGLTSLRERPGNLSGLTGVQRIIFLGSSGVGKSTLEKAVRTSTLTDPILRERVSVPCRVVTRSPRPDDGNDMYFVSPDELAEMVTTDSLGLYGIKLMEGGREEPYGYLKPREGALPVFFANNQTLKNRTSVRPVGVLDSALLVLIYTPDSVREQRLEARSPELFEERSDEVAFRLSRQERAIGLAPEAHLIVRNYGRFITRSAPDLIDLIKGITILL